MSRSYLVVDGHSVIHTWPELRALHQRNPRQAREALIKTLQTLHDTSAWAVTLIFDGRHGTQEIPDKAGFIVRYSQAQQTADSMIEGLVAAQKERGNITVITADQAERHVVEGLGAFCFSPDWLHLELAGQIAAFDYTKEQVRKRAKW